MAAIAPAAQASYETDALADRAAAEGRGIDQQANPDYTLRSAPLIADYLASGQTDEKVLHDPYRLDWGQTRGVITPVAFRNRYGATLRGNLYRPRLPWRDPVTGSSTSGPLPAIVVLPGYGGQDVSMEGLIQQIAEAGYVVLGIQPQGEGHSDVDPNPTSTYCNPNGSWREPQELGLREQGSCAGYDGPWPQPSSSPITDQVEAAMGPLAATPVGSVLLASFMLETQAARLTDPDEFVRRLGISYQKFRARFAFAAFDAVKWLLSDANPWRSLVDAERVGIAGHSAGADGSVVAGNGDPLHRFKAVVAWDSYGTPPATMPSTVPTMLQQSEQQNTLGPWIPKPDPKLWVSYDIAEAARAADVPSSVITLRGSTHSEWVFIPFALIDPVAPLQNSSSRGHIVAAYYSIAWFDRWLKGSSDAAQAADARRRLLARQFDASVDTSSIGQGTWDPLTAKNVPYKIDGWPVSDALSRIFASTMSFDGLHCPSFEAGCASARARRGAQHRTNRRGAARRRASGRGRALARARR